MDAVFTSLTPGGVFIARTPNWSSPFGGGYRYGDLTHETSFNARSLRQLGNTAGFRMSRSTRAPKGPWAAQHDTARRVEICERRDESRAGGRDRATSGPPRYPEHSGRHEKGLSVKESAQRTWTYDFAVIGLGYVGLPLAMEAIISGGLAGFGLDVSKDNVDALNDAHTNVDDISSATIADAITKGFFATTDPTHLAKAQTILTASRLR